MKERLFCPALKDTVFGAAGVVAAFITSSLNEIPESVILLVILILADYISGIVVAGVFHKSSKTEMGRLESRAGWKGLCRKVAVLVLVYICHHIDLTMGTNGLIMRAVVIGFALNEMLSLIENVGLMGVPMPGALTQAVEMLKRKADAEAELITYHTDQQGSGETAEIRNE